jgi:hypothetical protein
MTAHVMIRVTRLGEFSPIGWLFIVDSCFISSPIFWLLLQTVKSMYVYDNFSKKRIGLCFGHFFHERIRSSWYRCYDHNFLRFSTIFCKKNWRFSQKPMLWSKFCII